MYARLLSAVRSIWGYFGTVSLLKECLHDLAEGKSLAGTWITASWRWRGVWHELSCATVAKHQAELAGSGGSFQNGDEIVRLGFDQAENEVSAAWIMKRYRGFG